MITATQTRAAVAALQVELVETPQAVVARLIGEGGVMAADALQFSLLGLSAKRPALVVFDLAQLVFVASLVMGALVTFRRGVVRNGGKVKLAGLKPDVLEAFRTARLDELFEISESVDDALTP